MIYLTRRERFSSAHRMFRTDLTDEQNLELYGQCSNPEWHGHNYILYVTVKGEIDPVMGYVMNLTRLKEIMKEMVIDRLDHKNLNTQVDFLEGMLVSTENIAVAIWDVLAPAVEKEGVKLHSVKIAETENNFIEYFGE